MEDEATKCSLPYFDIFNLPSTASRTNRLIAAAGTTFTYVGTSPENS